MTSPSELVRTFHETFNHPINTSPQFPAPSRTLLRWALIAEEFTELTHALYGEPSSTHIQTLIDNIAINSPGEDTQPDMVETADALGDLVYVIYGMAHELGINLDAVLEEIQRSNMSKLDDDGNPIYREDGKILKGQSYTPPNIKKVLNES